MGKIQPLISAKNSIIDIYDGDGTNPDLTFTIKDEDGVILDISTFTILLVIKEKLKSSADVVAPITGTFVTDGTDGQIEFAFATVNITANFKNAYLTLYRLVAGKNQTLKQFTVNIIPNGTGS